MDDARNAWKAVGDKVESLGLKVKLHLEQEQDPAVAERTEGDTRSAFEQLSGQVVDAFDAFGSAANDDAVRADVREIAELIRDALIETFEAVGAEIGDLLDQIEDYAEDAAEKIADAVGFDGDEDGDEDGEEADGEEGDGDERDEEDDGDERDEGDERNRGDEDGHGDGDAVDDEAPIVLESDAQDTLDL